MERLLLTIFATLCICGCTSRNINLHSPDNKIRFEVRPGGLKGENSVASFTLSSEGRTLLRPSSIFIRMGGSELNSKVNLIRIDTRRVRSSWTNRFGEKKDVPDNYNELTLYLRCDSLNIDLVCRAYNEGVAIAYEIPEQNEIDKAIISQENIIFRFPGNHMSWSAPRAQAAYRHVSLDKIDKGCERPLLIESDSSGVLALTEASLVDYPRMKFDPDSSGGYSIKSRLDGPAEKTLPFRSPWRVMMTGRNPGDLLEKNYLILNLNDSSAIQDESWIKPGKVIREVTLTTEGAISAVDFASAYGLQYVEFDAGWYGPENDDKSDAGSVNVDPARSKGPLDLKKVIGYASTKNIGILLYVNRKALEKQIDSLLPLYDSWGVKGIKFGFVRVGSQQATSWLHESVKKAAEYNMIVDVHDEYRPTGFSRTWPNFLTQEGIRGDEESPSNSHTLTTMFTRMLAGAGDNTVCYYNDRVEKKMGSHASQLAKAVCIFSPLQFLYWYDRPSNIGNEPELEFFAHVPTVWDETKVLQAKPGECGIIARKKGDEWFIGGINGEAPQSVDLQFGFLDNGKKYIAKFYTDDPAVDTRTHVRTDSLQVDNTFTYRLSFNANNGFAIHVKPRGN